MENVKYTPTEMALIKMLCALSRHAIIGPDELAEEYCNDEQVQAFYDRFVTRVCQIRAEQDKG